MSRCPRRARPAAACTEIIARATQCKPDDRYAAPAELCAALEQYDAEQRRSVPTAQEMFHKPEQELSEVERMMLAILAEEAAAPVPEAEPEPETAAEEPAAEEVSTEEVSAEELVFEEPAAEEVPVIAPETALEELGAGSQARAGNPGCRTGSGSQRKPRSPKPKPQPARGARSPHSRCRINSAPRSSPAQPETPAKPKPEQQAGPAAGEKAGGLPSRPVQAEKAARRPSSAGRTRRASC